MKNTIQLLIFLAFVGCSLYFMGIMIDGLGDSIEGAKKEQGDNIGKVYVLDGDSLIIIDYSIWDDTYTLSNGVKINKSLVK